MKVKILRNPADSLGCTLAEGDTGDVNGDVGRRLVAIGVAVCLDPPPKPEPIKPVAPEPAIAEASPPTITAAKPIASKPKRKPNRQAAKPHLKES